jgi:hypothetical protein
MCGRMESRHGHGCSGAALQQSSSSDTVAADWSGGVSWRRPHRMELLHVGEGLLPLPQLGVCLRLHNGCLAIADHRAF